MRKLPTYIHPSHKVLRRTGHGRTSVCGDLHGCYDEVMCELSAVAFDHNRDTLIGLGDLIDRGTRCYECIKLLSEPWFTSILGNHDEMMLNAVNPRSDKSFWRANGSGWFDRLSFAEQEEVQFICEQYVEHLPLSMTLILPDGAQVGLIHGDAPNNWHEAIEGSLARTEVLWGRKRIRDGNTAIVKNVDTVLVGHTSNDSLIQLGNVTCLDTGAGFKNGRLTAIELGNSLKELQGNIVLQQQADSMVKRPGILFDPLGEYPMGDNV